MDSKNEDSAGSDSLDKTLQQKCKMDDTSQCGSKVLQSVTDVDSLAVTDIVGDGANVRDKAQASELGQAQSEQLQQHQSQNSSTKPLKTDTYLMGDGINAAATVARETSLRFFKASSTISNTIFSRDDSNSSTSSSSSSCGVSNSSNNNNNNNSSKSSSNSNNNSSNNNNNSSSSNNKSKNPGSHNIEKKVKQISQNLQETSLQVNQLMPVEERSNPELSSSPSSSSTTLLSASTSGAPTSTSSATSLPDNEQQPGPSRSNSASNSEGTLALSLSHSELNTNTLAANDSMEDNGDHRSKKVRFHPDAKENDGGNRIIPKKKKKFKETPLLKVFSADMDFDENVQEEDDIEEDDVVFDEEKEFDIERTIADAENYLQLNPIIFVPSMPPQKPLTNLKVPLPSGLMTEEDLELSDEENREDEDDDNDDDEKEATEEEYMNKNGAECILGKRCINGECSYLLRFVDKSALSWKPEHFINKNCPKLLNTYERNQQVQQENLMKYVAKRQNLRQRFTDF